MYLSTRRGDFLYWVIAFFLAPSWPASAADSPAVQTTDSVFGYFVVVGVALATIVGLATIRSALTNSTWSLADALSEEVQISPFGADGIPIPDKDGKPQLSVQLRASSSRFIALLGLIAILMMYIGFGIVILRQFASTGDLPSQSQMQEIAWFLFSGVTMFAPYIVNKFSSIFDWLTPTKK